MCLDHSAGCEPSASFSPFSLLGLSSNLGSWPNQLTTVFFLVVKFLLVFRRQNCYVLDGVGTNAGCFFYHRSAAWIKLEREIWEATRVKDDWGLGIPHSSSCSQELHSRQANNESIWIHWGWGPPMGHYIGTRYRESKLPHNTKTPNVKIFRYITIMNTLN